MAREARRWYKRGMPERSPRSDTVARLTDAGYAFLAPAETAAVFQVDLAQLNTLRDAWARLPRDTYLRDGGKYRSRRHSCFIESFSPQQLALVPHRPHWQPTPYNALHGGVGRWFEPVEPRILAAPVWGRLVGA